VTRAENVDALKSCSAYSMRDTSKHLTIKSSGSFPSLYSNFTKFLAIESVLLVLVSILIPPLLWKWCQKSRHGPNNATSLMEMSICPLFYFGFSGSMVPSIEETVLITSIGCAYLGIYSRVFFNALGMVLLSTILPKKISSSF
jgi:hypothetical protein